MIKRILNIFLFIFSLLSVNTAVAEARLDGYLSSQFGMSAKEVRSLFENDGVVFSSSETEEGDHLIFAQRKQSWITSELLYVFPANSDRLALVIEVFPGLVDSTPILNELSKKLGAPSSNNYPANVLNHMQESNLIPVGVQQLSVWNVTTDGFDREARVMDLDKYVRVEYLDNELMTGK